MAGLCKSSSHSLSDLQVESIVFIAAGRIDKTIGLGGQRPRSINYGISPICSTDEANIAVNHILGSLLLLGISADSPAHIDIQIARTSICGTILLRNTSFFRSMDSIFLLRDFIAETRTG